MNHLKLFLIGICVSAVIFFVTSCSTMPVCTSVVKLKLEVCPTE